MSESVATIRSKSFGAGDATPLDARAISGATHITDYDEIREVLRSPSFAQGAYHSSRGGLARDTVGVLEGAAHLQRRRLMAKLFSKDALASYKQRHLLPVVEQELAALDPHGADLVPLAQRCLYSVAAAVTGIDGLDDPAAADRFIAQVRAITDAFMVDWLRQDPDEVTARGVEATEAFRREFFEPSAARRRALVASGEAPRDLVSLMYANWDERWDDEQPLREASLFLLASTQTTAGALVLFVLRLEAWFDDHPGDRALTTGDESFLRRAAAESLRLTVASPARVRTAVEDVVLASGRRVEAGERLALWFVPANADGRFGKDAASFDPHRVVEAGVPWGLAFGAGPHACAGRPLATGIRTPGLDDGSMVTIARRLYASGLELAGEPVPDEGTHYDQYVSVPIRLRDL
jgi:cytochrome P450